MNITLDEIVVVLGELIRIPSYSREEEKRSDYLYEYLQLKGLQPERIHNNIMVRNKYFDPRNQTMLLNSHLDTVREKDGWTRDPFDPEQIDGKLFGLGSNDAGASLVSLMAAFLYFIDLKDLKYNLIFLASAEEEISGEKGVESVLNALEPVSFGIVGEPTRMEMAIAEKGLMVLDCKARGRTGHAARDEGINAIYKAMEDVNWIRNFQFPEKSDLLGDVRMTVTVIHSGSQHNVIPEKCEFVVDVRSTDVYTHEEILHIIKKNLKSKVVARSTRLNSSSIDRDHILVKTASDMGIPLFGSSTLSDQALMPFPTAKIGPGDSARSHTADEYIRIEEIREGIGIYKKLLNKILTK